MYSVRISSKTKRPIAPPSSTAMTERGDSCPPPQEEQGTKKRKHLELEEGWKSVEEGIEKLKRILELKNPKKKRKYRFSSEEYINLYTAIYDLCTQQSHACPAEVYQKYCTAVVDYLRFTVLPSLNDKHGEFLLREVVFRWDNHKVMLRWLSRLFDYLDRWYIYQNQLETLAEVALSRFRDEVFNKVMKRIRGVVLEVIDRERDGEEVDRSLLKNVVGLFVELGCYEKDFELFLVENSIKHYSRKSAKWIVEDSCPEYLRKVEGCLDEERNRVRSYLVSSSMKKVMHYVRKEMLIRNWRQLLKKEDSGVRVLIRDNRVDDLALICKIYRVLKKGKRALDFVFAMFGLCVAEECNVVFPQAEELAKSESQDKVKKNGLGFVDKAFELYGKYLTDQVVGCFENDNNFRLAFAAPFAAFCNKKIDGRPMSELLASYLDSLLRKGLSDKALDESLDKLVSVLNFVRDKDLFCEFSWRKLSQRLLFDRSCVNDHQERLALMKMRQHLLSFATKMETMLTDIVVSKEHLTEFKEYVYLDMDLNVSVLTTGSWPTYKSFEINLPLEMVNCVEAFNTFYKLKKKSKKLRWIYSLGSCNLDGRFEARTIEIVTSTLQAATLLLFNDSERLSYSEIKTQLKVADEELIRVLKSLSCLKYKILKKDNNVGEVSQKDVFEFNSKFTDKMRRIKVPLPPLEERKQVVEDVDKQRVYAVEACLVRIMKSRKVLSHQDLVRECIEQLSRERFRPDIKVIKTRIQGLIERDYLERDETDSSLYKYLS